MRHGKKFNHLGRQKKHRELMLANMACSLIEHKRVFTTVAKAKALRTYIEPLVTKSKNDTMHSRRVVFSYLRDKEATTELYTTVRDAVINRPGGYTRIIKTGRRLGDGAEMAMIEFVDFNDIYNVKETKTKTRRSRKKSAAPAEPTAEAENNNESAE
ncbi:MULTISPECIES: 50S ribosomal protein L17 [unclassified Flammeovirga]|uniref:50S ribosomal protein L17 n=1 Tax=unclassified Flammeovirga TaxID=2637820 RepID=UPI0005C5BF22|nr:MULTISPECIES: 50S ribosomal protein L17 [unclassified Flammeovirga]MBD0400196.1 50S ribosomal protein L17 [Flammeovirga sp. EKP202]